MSKSSIAAAIGVFKNLDSSSKLPYCTGTFPWDEDNSTLFYKGGSTFLKFPATQSELKSLSDACCGKFAGKFDRGEFGTSFSPWAEGLVDILEDGLLQGVKPNNIGVELSRLDMYGPGGSSKAHLVVPSSMIASLVVILPTVYEGGSLILRRGKKQWAFDSSEAVNTTPGSAQAAFIASHRDVKHEVDRVTSGYLVMLTYNLYIKKGGNVTITTKQESAEPEIVEALGSLLEDPAFIPGGGYIGFGLSHTYPFVVESTKLPDINENLRGPDAIIQHACESLSLDVSVKAVYFDDEQPGQAILIDEPSNCDYQTSSAFEYLADHGAKAVALCKQDGTLKESGQGGQPMTWLRPLNNANDFTFYYILEDDRHPSMEDATATVCLVATVPPVQKRGLSKDGSGPHKKRRRIK